MSQINMLKARKKLIIKFEVLATSISLIVGFVLHAVTEDWKLAVIIATAVEIFLHLFAFSIRYIPLLETRRSHRAVVG
jgi:hypothetical protein